jgi:hypothetical protein
MGLLDFLFRRNPTADWHEVVSSPAIDIGRCTIDGKGPGARLDDFRSFGRADTWPGKNGNGSLDYQAKGLSLDFEGGRFYCLLATLQPIPYGPPREPGHVWQGRLTHGGAPVPLKAGSTESHVIESFGEPTRRDDEEDEVVLTYQFGDVTAEFEILKPQGLAVINLYSDADLTKA